MDRLRVVKIGGNVIDSPESLLALLQRFASMEGPKVLVHGGGKLATELSGRLGIVPQMVDGRRITSEQDLEVVTMVYAGLINKRMTALLQSMGCNAIGMSGADGNVILAHRRPVREVDFGLVGDVRQVNGPLLQSLLKQGISPVLCAITHDGAGQLLNTNADTIAAEVAVALSGLFDVELIYCFEKKGVMRDAENGDSVIARLSPALYTELRSTGAIHSGMIPKLDNCFAALERGVGRVVITDGETIGGEHTHGTIITTEGDDSH
ncbi:MAG: acetylglutamate kinase [Flavobacteriales bacterium]|nr:acetylglutamate kinase [Flavobacteriales bacterium]